VVEKDCQEMEARPTLSARGPGYGSYVCQEIEAQAQYNAGFFDLDAAVSAGQAGDAGRERRLAVGRQTRARFRLSRSADLGRAGLGVPETTIS